MKKKCCQTVGVSFFFSGLFGSLLYGLMFSACVDWDAQLVGRKMKSIPLSLYTQWTIFFFRTIATTGIKTCVHDSPHKTSGYGSDSEAYGLLNVRDREGTAAAK